MKFLYSSLVYGEQALQRAIGQHWGFILGVFLFNYTSIGWSLWQTKEYMLMAIDGIFVFAGTALLAFVLALVPFKWLRRCLFGVVFGLSLLLWCGELFAIYNYGALIGAGMLNAVLETNPQEAREFLRMYVGWQIPTILVLLLGLLRAGQHFLFRRQLPLSPGWQNGLMVLLLLSGLLAGSGLWHSYSSYIANNILDIPLVRVVDASMTAVENVAAYKDIDQKLNTNAQITANTSDTPHIVFVLGESTNRDRMHLYGYELPNTPNLDALQAKGELAVFRDCISPHATTVSVIRELFTFHDAESPGEWYQYSNLIDVMNAAGYKTHWLSNQESSGIWGNTAQLFARRSQVRAFTHLRESHEDTGGYDEELFPLLEKAQQEASAKNFYVVHLMGAHSLYYMRFPYVFSRFSAQDINGEYTDEQRTEIAQYANALYYNDYIVSGIIDHFRQEDAIVIYLPDHGETVYDNGRNFAGHVEENPSHYMLEVPLVIWASSAYKAHHPEVWAAIQAAVDRPYMTDDMIHTILQLAGIRTLEYNSAKSIISPNFVASRPRMVQGRDYDRQLR